MQVPLVVNVAGLRRGLDRLRLRRPIEGLPVQAGGKQTIVGAGAAIAGLRLPLGVIGWMLIKRWELG